MKRKRARKCKPHCHCLPCTRLRGVSKVAHYHVGDRTVRRLKTRIRKSR